VIVCIALTLSIMILGTRWGIGVGPDSTSYLGLRSYDPGLSPLYTAMIALGNIVNIKPTYSAWWINWFCFLGTVLTVFFAVFRATGRLVPSSLAAFLILTLPYLVVLQITVMSESLFLFLCVFGLFLLTRFLESGQLRFNVAAALIIGASALARYPGIVSIGMGVILILLMAPQYLRAKIRNAAIFSIVSAVPIGIFLLYGYGAAGTIGARKLGFYGNADLERYLQGARSLMGLLLPTKVPELLSASIFLAAVSLIVWLIISHLRDTRGVLFARTMKDTSVVLPVTFLGFAFGYVVFLVLSVQIEPDLPLYGRYMPPIYVTAVPATICLAHKYVFGGTANRVLQLAVLALGGLLALSNTARTITRIGDAYSEGLGFSARKWRESKIINHLRNLPPRARIYSNGYDAIIYLTDHDSVSIPPFRIRRTGELNREFGSEILKIEKDLRDGKAIIVWLDLVTWRDLKLQREDEFIRQLPVEMSFETEDGRIYSYKDDKGS